VSYFAADLLFLLVKRALLGLRDATAVCAGHGPLFGAHLMVLLMQLGRLSSRDLAFAACASTDRLKRRSA
jgi:hypothetical protein